MNRQTRLGAIRVFNLAGALGVAPRTSVLETEILLLNYAPILIITIFHYIKKSRIVHDFLNLTTQKSTIR